jgi:hypothetical protein
MLNPDLLFPTLDEKKAPCPPAQPPADAPPPPAPPTDHASDRALHAALARFTTGALVAPPPLGQPGSAFAPLSEAPGEYVFMK